MSAIRRNDTVLVIAGKDRGKQGVVRQVIPKKTRAIVDGVNYLAEGGSPA